MIIRTQEREQGSEKGNEDLSKEMKTCRRSYLDAGITRSPVTLQHDGEQLPPLIPVCFLFLFLARWRQRPAEGQTGFESTNESRRERQRANEKRRERWTTGGLCVGNTVTSGQTERGRTENKGTGTKCVDRRFIRREQK